MGVFAVVLQTLACLGYGAVILRVTQTQFALGPHEQLAWALGLGSGAIGWLGFFLGIGSFFNNAGYFILLTTGLIGIVFVKNALIQCRQSLKAWSPAKYEIICLLAIGIIAVLFLSNALVPPTDADSLAYHFHLPKYFNSLGQLEFVPRAVDAASPMLAQIAYIPVYGLGGELGLTLWVMVNGWIAAFLLFTLCRRFLPIAWSLSIVLLLISVPAYVYGAGSGQIEVRISIFVMIAAFSLSAAIQTGLLRHVIICAIAVGFFMAAKYTGLLFAFACGIVIVMQKRGLVHGLVLTSISVLVGCQWYIWNAAHTGDPVFPMLFELLANYVDYQFWNAEQNKLFIDNYLASEKVLEPNILNFIRYPFVATFFDLKGLESSRAGLGPYLVMAFPFAVLGLWSSRRHCVGHTLWYVSVLIFVFYAAWFFAGTPQRVRHLLPIYPLALICMSVAAIRGAHIILSPFVFTLGVLLILIIQFGGTSLYSLGSLKYLLSNQTREQFFSQRLSSYTPIPWINERLKPTDNVYIERRELALLFNAPVYVGHPITQSLIQPQAKALRLRDQLYHQKITYLFLPQARFDSNTGFGELLALGCIEILKTFNTREIKSRTRAANNLEKIKMNHYSVARFLEKDCFVSPQSQPLSNQGPISNSIK